LSTDKQTYTQTDTADNNTTRPAFVELIMGSQNNMPDETHGINNVISCYKEAVQSSASFVMSLPVFDKICGTPNDFVFLSSK